MRIITSISGADISVIHTWGCFRSSSRVSNLFSEGSPLLISHEGPSRQSEWDKNWHGDEPRLAQSAAFSSDFTCLQHFGGMISVISATLFATNVYHREGSPCSHPSTTLESVHPCIVTVCAFIESTTFFISCASNNAPHSSIRGNLICLFKGANFALPATIRMTFLPCVPVEMQ